MQDIQIAGTRRDPGRRFPLLAGDRLAMSGEAYPENAASFFDPLLAALAAYLGQVGGRPVLAELALRYLNSASTNMLFRLIGLLDRAAEGGRPVTLRFAVHPEDEVLREFVEDLKADLPGSTSRP